MIIQAPRSLNWRFGGFGFFDFVLDTHFSYLRTRDFGVRKNINTSSGQASSVIATDLVKAIGDGIIGNKSSAGGGKEYSGFAVRSQPDDFPEAFAHNLLRMEFTSILDVLRLLDSGIEKS